MAQASGTGLPEEISTALADRSTPPDTSLSPAQWLRRNLFSSIANSIISVVLLGFGAFLAVQAARWVLSADYEIVRVNLRIAMIGQFPRDELWRPWASGFVLVGFGAFAAGALTRSAYESNREKDLPAHRDTWPELVRRFWAVIAVLVFFVSFARTIPPYLGLAVAFALVVIGRELGWRAPAAVRARAPYLTAAAVIVAMMILAGSSGLGGFSLGLVAAAWLASELGRRELPPGRAGALQRWGIPLAALVGLWVLGTLIPFDGFGWEDWGGLHITLFTTVVGITLGLPVGILLALGRRSDLPVLKTASVLFIEFVRGVPLISLLLFSNLMLPLFLPVNFDRPADLTLAVIVITGFSAAYIAEIVRGGLQAVPRGQTEAAQASGMGAWDIQRLIVLPQALRAVIPAMVGQFIALFKDTSLLSIIGILEFLRFSDVANAQPDFVGKGLASVTYLFVAIGYWAFAFTMSKESRRLEQRLGVGVR